VPGVRLPRGAGHHGAGPGVGLDPAPPPQVGQDVAAVGRHCKAHGVIFHTDATAWVGRMPTDVEAAGVELFDTIRERIRDGSGRWRREIRIERAEGTLALVCRGSTLADPDAPKRTGHVVVFDDVTVLDQAQRQAAWAELARRLAHEIKNPLTPIRLAAERLQLKLASRLEASEADLVARSTGRST